MKRFYSILSAILFCMGCLNASASTDSLSYALGHQYTLGIMAGKNDLMQSEEDFLDYIRGLEDNSRNLSQMSDSSYMMSYYLGAMETVFITDGVHGKKKEDLPPFPCIIAGLRKVGNGEISLPADTVGAMAVINRYSGDGMKPEDFDADISCRFFEAYGTMKAYQPGLQEYINGLNPGTACVANRKAFATGMADLLEMYAEPPKTAYDLGRSVAMSINIGEMDRDSPCMASFVAGAKAALWLAEPLIPRDEVKEIMNRQYMQESGATAKTDGAVFERFREFYDKLEVELDTPYSVNWTVTAGTVADERTEAYHPFMGLVSKLDITENCIPGIVMSQPLDRTGMVYETALSEIEKYSLPEGYKWFCGRNADDQTTIGIMRTDPLFKAEVHKASVYFDAMSGMINVEWKFDVADALKWAEFTAANIGKHVAMEIDGGFMFAPRVNQQISGGSCAISSLPPEEINLLFKDAKKEENQTPVDTEEVIEIE
ncbi:MAG: hypothetical protein J6L79_05280 [Muribaculaceae bacterium]|nr:hypothetical protein [Muribaculaceae bacterium]